MATTSAIAIAAGICLLAAIVKLGGSRARVAHNSARRKYHVEEWTFAEAEAYRSAIDQGAPDAAFLRERGTAVVFYVTGGTSDALDTLQDVGDRAPRRCSTPLRFGFVDCSSRASRFKCEKAGIGPEARPVVVVHARVPGGGAAAADAQRIPHSRHAGPSTDAVLQVLQFLCAEYREVMKIGVDASGDGRHRWSVEAFRRALLLAPLLPDAHANLGTALMRLGSDWSPGEERWAPVYQEALRAFDAALQLEPGHSGAESGRRALERNIARRVRQFADGKALDLVAETARIVGGAYKKGAGRGLSDGGWEWLVEKQEAWEAIEAAEREESLGSRPALADEEATIPLTHGRERERRRKRRKAAVGSLDEDERLAQRLSQEL
jgi:hypothetical protein